MTTTITMKAATALLALVLCACGGANFSEEIVYLGSDAAPPSASASAPDGAPADPPPTAVVPAPDAGLVALDAGELGPSADAGAGEAAAEAGGDASAGAADAGAADAADACVPRTIAEVCVGADSGQSCTQFGCVSGQVCGLASDGCGGQVLCPGCTTPMACGGGGPTGVCGCTVANAGLACLGIHP